MPDRVLDDEIDKSLRDLILQAEDANREARQEEVRWIQQNREFYKGNQNITWDPEGRRYIRVTDVGATIRADSENLKDIRFDYVTNIFRANANAFVALFGRVPTKAKFSPENASEIGDLEAARAADDVSEFIERKNKIEKLRLDKAMNLTLDGGFGSYVRYVVDGDKFGWVDKPIMGTEFGQLASGKVQCPNPECGYEEELPAEWFEQGGPPPDACSQCGTPLGPESLIPPLFGNKQVETGHEFSPNGKEVIDVYGFLELQRPYWCNALEDMPWLILEFEIPKGRARKLYPKYAEAMSSTEVQPDSGVASLAREARLLTMASQYDRRRSSNEDLVTVRQVWMRPEHFYEIDDLEEARNLEAQFPKGAYVTMVGSIICDKREENMNDVWSICQAFPGHGQMRGALMSDMIDVQRRYNNEENIAVETFEFGIPTRFTDSRAFNKAATDRQAAAPGNEVHVDVPAGKSVSDMVHDTKPATVSPQLTNHLQWLMGETTHQLTGLFPAVYGGNTGSNSTMGGIEIARDQALGRIATVMVLLRVEHAEMMYNAVRCFANNRKDDVSWTQSDESGAWVTRLLKIKDLKGGFSVEVDPDESIPRTWSERRAIGESMLSHPNQEVANILFAPANTDFLEDVFGRDGIKVPGADARIREMRIIAAMRGMPAPQSMGIDPATGQPLPPQSNVPIDPVFDDFSIGWATCREWACSDEGMRAQEAEPDWYANVRARAEALMGMYMQQQQAAAPAQEEV